MTTIAEQLADAERATAQLRAQAQAEQAAALQRADAARDQWDRDFMSRWKDEEQQAEAEQKEAAEAFRQAVLADPVFAAYIRWRAARARQMAVRRDALNIGNTIGADNRPAGEMTWRFPELLDALVPILEREAGILGETDSEQRYDERAQVEQAARRGDA